jgi:predicted transposase YbfD/YdcC
MEEESQKSLQNVFEGIEDPRVDRTKRHLLLDILLIAILAVILGTQRAIAAQIIEQKGDYVLALKENQGNLYENVEETFRLAQPSVSPTGS